MDNSNYIHYKVGDRVVVSIMRNANKTWDYEHADEAFYPFPYYLIYDLHDIYYCVHPAHPLTGQDIAVLECVRDGAVLTVLGVSAGQSLFYPGCKSSNQPNAALWIEATD